MELYQLQYFLHVAQYENMTKAARELRVGQPAISKAVQALEAEMQVQLLERNGKRIGLTHEGKLLQTRLLPLLLELETIPSELQLYGERKELIRLNLLSCNLMIAEVIRAFRDEEPNVIFSITEQREKTDWDLCICSTAPEIGYTNGEHLFDERILLASRRGGWLDDRERVVFEELRKESFIMLRRGAQTRNIAEARFRAAGFVPNIGFECDTLYIAQRLVTEGLGVTLWPEYTWGRHEDLKLTAFSEDMRRSVYLLQHTEGSRQGAATRFAEFVKRKMKSSGGLTEG
ncbi:MAG: LysR family transcriptional regulator [Eubacteriales bacterium]|nr:LysR family transcriptional regulator [Eubacteriales bacterium]